MRVRTLIHMKVDRVGRGERMIRAKILMTLLLFAGLSALGVMTANGVIAAESSGSSQRLENGAKENLGAKAKIGELVTHNEAELNDAEFVEVNDELVDLDDVYPQGVEVKLTYEADKDLYHITDIDDPEAKRIYATPEDTAYALPSIMDQLTKPSRRQELKANNTYVIEEPLLLFHPDDIPERIKDYAALKKRQMASIRSSKK